LVGDDANAIEPGKRPLSSMTPTFLIGKDRRAAIGTPGGSRIITMVLLGALEIMQGKDAEAAVTLPRFHHQYLPDAISAEPGALSETEIAALQKRGFTVSPNERTWGNMQIVLWDLANGKVSTGSDPRWKTVGGGGIFR
jgi:gamma-glutamyltranspeptidase / glutathione hydrolase